MPRAHHYKWLWRIVLLVEGADSDGFVEAVHDRHAYVCDDEAVDMLAACEGVLDFCQGLQAVVGTVN